MIEPAARSCPTADPTREMEATARAQRNEMVRAVDGNRWQDASVHESFTELFVSRIAGATTFVDVGAERGFYSYLALRTMPAAGRIIAVEPDPVRHQLLVELFGPAPNVQTLHAAAWDAPGTIDLVRPPGRSATSIDAPGETFAARTVTLDEIVGDDPVDCIKIDVEGAEGRVFAGMVNILRRQRPQLFFEFHPWCDQVRAGSRQFIDALLQDTGYEIHRTDRGRCQHVPRVGGRMWLRPT